MENKTIKEQIISKLKELREDVYNHSLNDEIFQLVWNNIDEENYVENHDKALYIGNELGDIKAALELCDQLVGEGAFEDAKPHYNKAIWNVDGLIGFVERNL
jgi:hypothetical protein